MTATVLDVTAGSRMMWFDPTDPRAVFADQRSETVELCDGRTLEVTPDIRADFRNLPFSTEQFNLVVFDPPHLKSLGKTSWTQAKYGSLFPTWRDDLAAGFSECFRVLKTGGTLIFKWSEHQIPTKEVLALTDQKPLFGHRSGRASKTHWIAFTKGPRP